MDMVEITFERLEKALEGYRQSLKAREDEPGTTAKEFAKDATQSTSLRLSIKQGLDSLMKLEVRLPSEDRERIHQRQLALQQEFDNLVYHHLTG